MLNQISKGFSIPFQAIKFLFSNKKLFAWIGLPVFLNFVIYTALFYILFTLLDFSLRFLDLSVWYEKFLYIVIISAGIVLAVFFVIFTFVALTNIVGAPFYEILSRKTSKMLKIEHAEIDHTALESAKIFGQSITAGLKRILIFFAAQIALLLISLLPLIGATIIAIFNIIITSWFLAMEFLDFEFDRKEWDFDKKMALFKKNKWSMMGFGLAILLGSMLPLFNLLFLPCCIIAASLYFKEFLHKK